MASKPAAKPAPAAKSAAKPAAKPAPKPNPQTPGTKYRDKDGSIKVYGPPKTKSGLPSTGNSDLDERLDIQNAILQDLYASGGQVNERVEITPDKVREFQDQVDREVGPYYAQIFDNYRADFDRAVGELVQDASIAQRQDVDAFGRTLRTTQDNLAERGLAFSGERLRQEGDLAQAATDAISARSRGVLRQAGDMARTLEREVGSRNVGDRPMRQFDTYDVTKAFTPGQTTTGQLQKNAFTSPQNVFSFSPNVTGRLEEERERANRLRLEELKTAYREQQAMNL